MTEATHSFSQLGLSKPILSTLQQLGYETPTQVQVQSIPILLEGSDLLAQAQTGTGKTAAFALPALMQVDVNLKAPQVLVLAPTRELAIQVSEAFQSYAKQLPDFHVMPIYGGQGFRDQLRALKRGVHVVVGTPGRTMDHIRRGTLSLDAVKLVVLDEADEMLNMGFVEDIEWILQQMTHKHQTALFSATMPAPIRKITSRYQRQAKEVHIKATTRSDSNIEQSFVCVKKDHKLEVMTRFLEVEDVDAAIVFVRTKTASNELSDKLNARGYAASSLNGDMDQKIRKKVIEQIKNGELDIVVATDVAARGIDVERVTHVINFDIPYDTESYIHRIGRTGRAGRSGKALLLVEPRERRLLKDIEQAIRKPIQPLTPPSIKDLSARRSEQLAQGIMYALENDQDQLKNYAQMVNHLVEENDCTFEQVATALVYLMQQTNPLPTEEIKVEQLVKPERRPNNKKRYGGKPGPRKPQGRRQGGDDRPWSAKRKKPTLDGRKKPR